MKIKSIHNEAFTIVETLIVLAIVAVIIIIVLLAVPALQRTQENTVTKNDATSVAAAANSFVSDNGGSLADYISNVPNNPGQFWICVGGPYPANPCTASTTNEIITVSATDNVWFTHLHSFTGPEITYMSNLSPTTCNGTDCAVWYSGTGNVVLGPHFILVDFEASCSSTNSPINGSAGGGVTSSSDPVAVLYTDITGDNSGNIYCLQG